VQEGNHGRRSVGDRVEQKDTRLDGSRHRSYLQMKRSNWPDWRHGLVSFDTTQHATRPHAHRTRARTLTVSSVMMPSVPSEPMNKWLRS
jgi:hypothetical protein